MHQSGRPDAGFPSSLVPVAARIEERIRDLLDGELARWRAVDPALAEPLTTLRAFVDAGGKRLRPAFCHCAFIGAGGDPQDKAAIDAGAALELVHTFALLHDDVMDGSDRRRGVDAVHHDFALRHERHGGRGEARRYGEGIAILVGDFAFVYADQLMRDAPGAALDIFDELRIELCVGQSLDLMGTAAASTDAELAHRIARFKSGKYTVERPLHLGAALAGRLDALAPALSDVGLPLGQAFQLRDDILGAFGDESTTGKPVGDDLREGKPTPLVAVAAARATPADQQALSRLGAPDITPSDVEAIQDVFVRTGARDQIELDIAHFVRDARTAIEAAPLTNEACDLLDQLALYVAWRDR
jgi:geranylgeranyl diphosphate synthase type I